MEKNTEKRPYSYYNIDAIRHLAKIDSKTRRNGEKLVQSGAVTLRKVSAGYLSYSDDPVVEIYAEGTPAGKEFSFPMGIMFSKSEIFQMNCRCPECIKKSSGYYFWSLTKNCSYSSAMLDLIEEYLSTHNIADATDRGGNRFLTSFRKERERRIHSARSALTKDAGVIEDDIELLPRIVKNNGMLEVGFRLGTTKKYLIKNLHDFCTNVRSSETAQYGSKTMINHDPGSFAPAARPWLDFILGAVQEDITQFNRIQNMSRVNLKKPKQSVIQLYGWRLDRFWETAKGTLVEYEDRDAETKKKMEISMVEGRPDITLNISRADDIQEDGGTGGFEGIKIHAYVPECWEGTDTLYFLVNSSLCRSERRYSSGIRSLVERVEDNEVALTIGRNHLSEFYNDVLPELEQYVNVTESDPEEIHSYVSPEVKFTFYLDAEGGTISCRAFASYGDQSFSLREVLRDYDMLDPFRQREKEAEVADVLTQLFPDSEEGKDDFFCADDEEMMYAIVTEGVDTLSRYGEVMSTSRFRAFGKVSELKISVGVSVSQGLLDLEITSGDVPRDELLDILSAYEPNKKYYKMKSGGFLNMQGGALRMLNELVQSMNIPPKELLKEKINIPAYRTLYLDSLLEENRSLVYADRDKNFRQLVRNFRTVGDSDFDEPESLSNVMRVYQKDGFKWLKTLAEYGFGGILADEMGLGKTLQAIAVFLSEAQSSEHRTSLVISPASLVYNWCEELEHYAPDLRVLVVAGPQSERRALIEEWQSYDVLVTSYDTLKRDIGCYEDKTFLYELIDEAQYIKNHTTAASKAVKVIKSVHRLALTGTPVENRLSELWSIFDFLMPGFLYSYEVFRKKFEIPAVKHEDKDAVRRLQQMVAPFILRRLKKDVLKDLPDKLEENRVVQLGEKQQHIYDGQVVRMQNMLTSQSEDEFGRNKIQILAELMKLRQICCDPSLCFKDYDSGSAKLESCLDLIESAIDGEHRMLVFSQFTSMLEILGSELKRRDISFYEITGATPKRERLRLVNDFNENSSVPVFLISLKAGGTGLNLTGADIVIHYDPWWNVAAQDQATDRAHRIGQTKKVTVYKMIVKNSIEEKIQKLQEAKKALADSIVGAADGISLGQLSRDELLELLR